MPIAKPGKAPHPLNLVSPLVMIELRQVCVFEKWAEKRGGPPPWLNLFHSQSRREGMRGWCGIEVGYIEVNGSNSQAQSWVLGMRCFGSVPGLGAN